MAHSPSPAGHQTSSLFRQAAVDACFMQQYGTVHMLPKTIHRSFAWVSALLLVISIVYISTQPFFETVNLTGWVSTTVPNIDVRSQESAGIVKQVLVNNGSTVSAGQTIAIIARSKGEALGAAGVEGQRRLILQEQNQRLAILAQNKQNLHIAADGIEQRYMQSQAQLSKILQHQHTHQIQLDTAKKRLYSLHDLLAQGVMSFLQVEQTEAQMLSLHQQDFELFMRSQSIQASHNDLREQKLTNQQKRQQVEHEITLLNIQTQKQLDALNNETQITVTAPSSGIIDNLQIDEGKAVAFNQVLTQIAPAHPRYFVQLAIPSHQVAFLQANQQVDIRVDGFAYQTFGSLNGVVSHISEQVINPQDISDREIRSNQALYLVDVEIEYTAPISSLHAISLRSGMTISASVNKQETTILRWLLKPLFDISGPRFTRTEGVL